MTTRIEIKNEGPSDVQILGVGHDERILFTKLLKKNETDSFLYVYHGQVIKVKEVLD